MAGKSFIETVYYAAKAGASVKYVFARLVFEKKPLGRHADQRHLSIDKQQIMSPGGELSQCGPLRRRRQERVNSGH
jgi:hypothetical protein